MKNLEYKRLATALVVASMAVMVPAHAQVFPPFEVGDGETFQPEVRRNDLGLQAHYLLPRAPAMMQSAQQTARAGLVSWRERSMDLRDTLGHNTLGDGGGVWMRMVHQRGDRSLNLSSLNLNLDAYPPDFDFDLVETGFEAAVANWAQNWAQGLDYDDDLTSSERQDLINANAAEALAGALAATPRLDHDHRLSGFNAGFDLIHGSLDSRAWLVGATIGYLRSTADFDDYQAWGAGTKLDGDTVNIGIYGGLVVGGLYVDATVSYAWHKLDMVVPLMRLRPEGAVLSTDARSLSAQLDAGWRFLVFGESFYIEPVAGLVWVRADIDDTNVQPSDAQTHGTIGSALILGRQESLRGSLGARVGDEWALGRMTLTGDLGLRMWREFERGSEARLGLRGDFGDGVPAMVVSPPVKDQFASSFTDISASAGLRTADGRLALGLNLSRMTASDYKSHGITANVRYQW